MAAGAGATTAPSAVQGWAADAWPRIQETFELSLVEVTAVFTTFALGTVDAGDPGRRGLRPDWRRWLSRVLALPRRRTVTASALPWSSCGSGPGDLIRDMGMLFAEAGLDATDREIGRFGSVHLYLAAKPQ